MLIRPIQNLGLFFCSVIFVDSPAHLPESQTLLCPKSFGSAQQNYPSHYVLFSGEEGDSKEKSINQEKEAEKLAWDLYTFAETAKKDQSYEDSFQKSELKLVRLLERDSKSIQYVVDLIKEKQKDKNIGAVINSLMKLKDPEVLKEFEEILIEILNDKHSTNYGAKETAAKVLGHSGSERAVNALVSILSKKEHDLYMVGVVGRGLCFTKPEKVIDTLIEVVKDTSVNHYGRAAAIHTLEKFGKEAVMATPVLTKALLEDERVTVRWASALALGEVGKNIKETVPALIKGLQDKDMDVREYCVKALGRIGAGAKEAVPDLVKVLEDGNEEIKQAATVALGEIGKDAGAAVPILINRLKSQDVLIRLIAVVALGNIRSKDAKPHLVKLLESDRVSDVRNSAAEALANIDPKDTIRYLIEAAINDENSSRTRVHAIEMLGKFGKDAEYAADVLIVLLSSDLTGEKSYATAQALAKIGNPKAIEPLVEKLKSELIHDLVKKVIVQALVELGTKSAQPLIELLKDKKQIPKTREYAACALGGIKSADSVQALIEVLQDEKSSTVKYQIVKALAGIKVRGLEPIFIKLLKNKSEEPLVRVWSAHALGELGANSEYALSPLFNALEEKNIDVRCAAVNALSTIGKNYGDKLRRPSKDLQRIDKEDTESEIKEIILALLKIYKNSNPETLMDEAAKGLVTIGPCIIPYLELEGKNLDLVLDIGSSCIEPLKKALENKAIKDDSMRANAVFLLGKLSCDLDKLEQVELARFLEKLFLEENVPEVKSAITKGLNRFSKIQR